MKSMVTITVVLWVLFFIAFSIDRSRYRNCYLLFLALLSLWPVILLASQPYQRQTVFILGGTVTLALIIVPFFLIHNGVVMYRKEGHCLANLLSFILGVVILIGELSTFMLLFLSSGWTNRYIEAHLANITLGGLLISATVIYTSISFLVFMIYTLFLQIIPRKRDFDYVIIHGAGLLDGDRISKLLADRLDKAIEVYRKDPTPPKMIPSGGKGTDETVSEAEAMAAYLINKGVPESDIIIEDKSATTFENLRNSKEIIEEEAAKGDRRKYTALVTSNYHVYRALRYCKKIGIKCTGIGSHVAFYYWPSALIREYIAVHSEKKHALIFIAGWLMSIAVPFIL